MNGPEAAAVETDREDFPTAISILDTLKAMVEPKAAVVAAVAVVEAAVVAVAVVAVASEDTLLLLTTVLPLRRGNQEGQEITRAGCSARTALGEGQIHPPREQRPPTAAAAATAAVRGQTRTRLALAPMATRQGRDSLIFKNYSSFGFLTRFLTG
jgi:hypothetical protein